ncbi:MAG: N-acetylmuramoyl-L-alanine amidase [Oscillospiraceae bacterium]
MEKKKNTKKMLYVTLIILAVAFFTLLGVFIYKVVLAKSPNANTQPKSSADAPNVPEGFFQTTAYEYTFLKGMRAIKVEPKIDIYKDPALSTEQVQDEVDKLLSDVVSLGFNAVIVDTKYDKSVIFKSEVLMSSEVDLLKIITTKAKEKDISVVAVFNITGTLDKSEKALTNHIDPQNKQKIFDAVSELTNNYELDSILLDSYYTLKSPDVYKLYVQSGAADSYENWLVDCTSAITQQVSKEIKSRKNSMPVGLFVDSVWANVKTKEDGLKATADFEALTSGFADTKAMAQSNFIDFINVKIKTSITDPKVGFQEAVKWWSNICEQGDKPFYVTHSAQNAVTKLPGWNGTDQLARQVAVSLAQPRYYGSAFEGYERLMQDPSGSTTNLKKYYANEYKESDLFTGITILSPKKTQYTTFESNVVFTGKFDPTQEVKINGNIIKPISNGGFSEWIELAIGKNTIKIEHKGETITYIIERQVDVLKEVSPTGTIDSIGTATLNLTAKAYKGSTVTAKINGTTVTLKEAEVGDGDDPNSDYATFKGAFSVPAATTSVQNLGAITFYGAYKGYRDSMKGATVSVQKKEEITPLPPPQEAVRQAVAKQIYTDVYAFKAPDDYAEGELYQIPTGTTDIIVSEMEMTTFDKKKQTVYNLRSGKTVKASDVEVINAPFGGNNTISSMVTSVGGGKTYIKIAQTWKAPFSVWFDGGYPATQKDLASDFKFTSSKVTITFDYTTDIAQMQGDIAASPMFSGVSTNKIFNEELQIYQYVMTLTLDKSGCYYGVHAYYEGDTLVFAFNNPASAINSDKPLSGIKILLDPGHGQNTGSVYYGAIEDVPNLELAKKIQTQLIAKGATVIMTRTDNSTNPVLHTRPYVGYNNKVDLLISVHHNAYGKSPVPRGIETHYNAPFSQPLAQEIQAQIKGHFTVDRGVKNQSNFAIARSKQFPSVLVENGFMSNKDELMQLIMNQEHQQKLAESTVQGIINFYKKY